MLRRVFSLLPPQLSLRAVPNRLPLPRHASPPARLFSSSFVPRAKYRRFGEATAKRSLPEPGNGGGSGGGSQWRSWANQYGPLRNLRHPPPVVYLVGGGGVVYYVAHLEKVEETGRWRFMDVSVAAEQQMGQQGYDEVMSEYRGQILPDHHPTARYVQRVANRILNASGLDGGEGGWDCHVVQDDSTRNAFVLPGGRIFVFTGILPACKNEDGLAVVLGHEIAHQVARHSAERMSSLKVLFVLSLLLESAGLDGGLSRTLLNLVMTLPNSRKSESEADYIGLKLATIACFDPREATGLWQRMDAAEGDGGKKGSINVDFLSTHPSSSKRVEKVTQWAKEMASLRPGSCGPIERQMPVFTQAASRFF